MLCPCITTVHDVGPIITWSQAPECLMHSAVVSLQITGIARFALDHVHAGKDECLMCTVMHQ